MNNEIILIDRFNFPIVFDFMSFKKLINDNHNGVSDCVINRAWFLAITSKEQLSIAGISTLLNAAKNQSDTFNTIQLKMQVETLRSISNHVKLNACNHVNLRNLIKSLQSVIDCNSRLSDKAINTILLNHFDYCINSIRELMSDKIPLINMISEYSKQADDIQNYLEHYP